MYFGFSKTQASNACHAWVCSTTVICTPILRTLPLRIHRVDRHCSVDLSGEHESKLLKLSDIYRSIACFRTEI